MRCIADLGRNLGLVVVAEGVESVVVADRLRATGRDRLQGFLVGRPVARAELELHLRRARAAPERLRPRTAGPGRRPARLRGPSCSSSTANGGTLPADADALARAGIEPEPGDFVNSGVVDGANLWFLGDVFAWPQPMPLANVFSVGDVLVVAGAVWGVHRVCRRGRRVRDTVDGEHIAA